jgi:hypothetical protein
MTESLFPTGQAGGGLYRGENLRSQLRNLCLLPSRSAGWQGTTCYNFVNSYLAPESGKTTTRKPFIFPPDVGVRSAR